MAATGQRGGQLARFLDSRGCLAVLLCLTALLYLGTLGFEPLNWDDPEYVANPLYAQPDALARIWTSFDTPQVYPLVFTSFWLESRVWGARTWGPRVDQIALHLLATVLLWSMLRRLLAVLTDEQRAPRVATGRSGGSTLPVGALVAITALFAVHPIAVGTVAWLAERKNLLTACFSFMSVIAYLRFRERGSVREWALVLLAMTGALLSKTTAVTLPVSFLLLEWCAPAPARPNLITRLSFFAPAIAMSALTVLREHGPTVTSDVAPIDRIWVAALGVVHNLRVLVFPVRLSPLYSRWDVAAARPFGIAAAVGLGIALLLLLRARRKAPLVAFGAWQFVLALAPTAGVIPFGYMDHSFVADHFLYWPSWGFWLALVAGLSVLGKLGPLLTLLWIVPSVALTPLHARVYRDSGVFWRSVLAGNPNSWGARTNYGQWLALREAWSEAQAELERSIAINPRNPDALFNLGYVHDRRGEWTQAVEFYNRTLALDPTRDDARSNLTRVERIQGESARRRATEQ